MKISEAAREALRMLLHMWPDVHGRNYREKRQGLYLFSDASDFGFGGVLSSDAEGRNEVWNHAGQLPLTLLGTSSFVRESYAIAALMQLLPGGIVTGMAIDVYTDNQGAMARMILGTNDKQASEFSLDIAIACVQKDAELAAVRWIPRARNRNADLKSREAGPWGMNYSVTPTYFKGWLSLLQIDGYPVPNIDAYACSQTRQLDRYCTLERPTPIGAMFDGLNRDWGEDDVLWIFPPAAMIAAACAKWRVSASKAAFVCMPEQVGAAWWQQSHERRIWYLPRGSVTGDGANDEKWTIKLLKK